MDGSVVGDRPNANFVAKTFAQECYNLGMIVRTLSALFALPNDPRGHVLFLTLWRLEEGLVVLNILWLVGIN